MIRIALFILLTSCACSSTVAAARIQGADTALNVMTDIVDPAYEATRVGCDAADRAALLLAKENKITVAELEARVQESRARCNTIVSIYEKLVALQHAAREALELAKVDNSEQKLQEVDDLITEMRQLWQVRP